MKKTFRLFNGASKTEVKREREREPDNNLIGKTFAEYVKYETEEKSAVATLMYSLDIGQDPKYINFDLKLRYYWNCFEDLKPEQKNIIKLWEELLELYKDDHPKKMRRDLLTLAVLTVDAKVDEEFRGTLDQKILDFAEKKIYEQLRTDGYDQVLLDIVDWYYFRVDYYKKILIGSTERELHFLRRIRELKVREFERVKSELPWLFIRFSHCVDWFYTHLPDQLDSNYDSFYEEVLLAKVIVFRSIGDVDEMSEAIYQLKLYQNRNNNGLWNWILRVFTGYGEKPLRVVYLYMILNVMFLIIFLIPIFNLSGIEPNFSLSKKIINILYFINTTFLTIGYGDILPGNNIPAKIAVLFAQTMGFIVAGSLVTLSLRKMFRY